MKFILMIYLLIFIGCASNTARQTASLTESLNSAKCKPGEFRGLGFGISEREALTAAQSELAKQISSSINVSERYTRNQQVSNGNENLSSEFESKIVIEANLLNIQDAHVLQIERNTNETGVVVCMSRLDAAKGFIENQRLTADSLELISNTLLSTEHPKKKNESWQKTQMLWTEILKIQNLLESWDIEKSKTFISANETYTKAKDYYKHYCKNQENHWEDSANECSAIAFAVLSKKIKMEKSACSSNGLKLRFTCSEKCASSSLGAECSFEPSLSLESCNGEQYSLLKPKEPIMGYDMHNTSKAKENLIKSLPAAFFFDEWEKEIKNWIPQCAD